MAEASDFVGENSVRVRPLVLTIVGGMLVAWWEMSMLLLTRAATWFERLVLTPFAELMDVLVQLLFIPANSQTAANQAAVEFMMRLEPLGPLVWPLAMIIAFATIWALQQFLDHYGVI